MLVAFKMQGMERAQENVQRMRSQTKPALTASLEELAQRATLTVASRIGSGEAAPIAPLTSRKRQIGKEPGAVWPAIPSYGSDRPLRRSGRLESAITYEKMAPLRFVVGVEAGRKGEFSGGRMIPLAWIAALQETGFQAVVPITVRMVAYLKVLFGEITRKPTAHLPHGSTGKTLSVWVPARPVWSTAFEEIAEWGTYLVIEGWWARVGLMGGK